MKLKYYIPLLLLLGSMQTAYAQTAMRLPLSFDLNGLEVNGSVLVEIDIRGLGASEKVFFQGGVLHFQTDDFEETSLLIKFSDWKWNSNVASEILDGLELSFRKDANWSSTQPPGKIRILSNTCVRQDSDLTMVGAKIIQSGPIRLNLYFGAAIPPANCRTLESFSGTLSIDFMVEPLAREVQEPEDEPQAEESPEESNSEEEGVWTACNSKPTRTCLQAYIRAYPQGAHFNQAKQLLRDLDRQAWENASRLNSIAAYNKYVREWPDGDYRTSAQRAIDQLQQQDNPSSDPEPEPSDPAEEAWEKTLNADSPEKYEEFIRNFPNSPHADEARQMIRELVEIFAVSTPLPNMGASIYLENVIDPQVILPSGDSMLISPLKDTLKGKVFEVRWFTPANRSIRIFDPGKRENKQIDIPLNDLIRILENRITGDGKFLINFTGGIPRYSIFLRSESRMVRIGSPFSEKQWTMDTSAVAELAEFPGTYDLVLGDQRATVFVPFNTITKYPKPFPWIYLTPLPILLLLLLWNQRRKRKKQEALEALKEQRKKEREEEMSHLQTTDVVQEEPQFRSTKESGQMKIKKMRKIEGDAARKNAGSGEALLAPDTAYTQIAIARTFSDSAVENIYLSRNLIRQIDDFISDPKHSIDESEGKLPEIGGFLMGRVDFAKENRHQGVTIEAFVPINPDAYSVYQLEFNTQSLVRELGDCQDRFPDYFVVGWFHTHPGHGLFLSKPDITIQDGFFTRSFQFAMEIDPLSPGVDTAFFTRKRNLQVNNKNDRISGASWYSWRDIHEGNQQELT